MVVMMIVLVTILFAQVVMRNMMTFTFTWTEELARYLFIWTTFIGVSYAVKKNKHIKIDSLALLFKKNGNFVMRTISNLLFLAFAILVVYYGLNTVFGITRTTPGLGISYGWVYASTLVGFFLTVIRLIQDQWHITSRWKNNKDVDV
ncbi:C4-dicarboxylate transport system small permease [Gracilibacillus halophilus YIM-C55.5]|uniref:C4-dicarboxylate transport system small permease n=2 Tax=Gracilibacillus TaxID=74385 RepID=N4WNT2_9BACI|nr:C4-dicarboxylate transport system small permease [Gracilibacillus halophilus YIM-C55.5]